MVTSKATLLALTLLLLIGCTSMDTSSRVPTGTVENTDDSQLSDFTTPESPTTTIPVENHTSGTTSTTADNQDLWAQLRAGFKLPDKQRAAVKTRARVYAKTPHQVERIFRKGKPYLAYIHAEVARRDLPAEVTLLPFIESGYNPFAYSQSRAAGLWQFIPGTGKQFGLKQDWWYDGRRDVIASTNAALDYLVQLNREFKGDWLLTFAAYNAGGGTVRNAIKRNRKAGKPTNYWQLELPTETEKYIPKLLAISTIVESPDKYAVTLPPVSTTPMFTAVDTDRQLDITVAAELADIDAGDLYALNPGLNRWTTHPEGPHTLAIPVEKSRLFEEKLAQLPESARVLWKRHTIQRGETLSGLAQRYDTTVAALTHINSLDPDRIRAGTKIMIPGSVKDPTRYAALSRRLQQNRNNSRKLTYKVRSGDNLWSIARRHQVSVKQVARWNRVDSQALLKPGQKLVIWKGGKAADQPQKPLIYTVRNGDSLYRISRKFKVSIAQLRKWNNLPKGKYLQPGQNLKLYVDAGRYAKAKQG